MDVFEFTMWEAQDAYWNDFYATTDADVIFDDAWYAAREEEKNVQSNALYTAMKAAELEHANFLPGYETAQV